MPNTDRLSRARSEMDAAHAHLMGALEVFEDGSKPPSEGAWKLLARVAAEHTRALRELFLAELESRTEPVSREAYTADGPALRRLRAMAERDAKLGLEEALIRLAAFHASADDVRLVAHHLTLAGEHTAAADLLRRLEG